MYLILLGIIAVGAGLLLVYYSVKDKKNKSKPKDVDEKSGDTGKVIYLFDEDKEEEKTDIESEKSANSAPNEGKDETDKDEKPEKTDKDE